MGKLVLAAKITHVPSMYLSERPGPDHGCREAAIRGLAGIGERLRDLRVDTVVVFDTHWRVNVGYHINAFAHAKGLFTSAEFPDFVQNMPYDVTGDPALADAIAAAAAARGVEMHSHHLETLELAYGTILPMRYLDPERRLRAVPIAACCPWHEFDESRAVGAAVRAAAEAGEGRVAVLASGSLSHRFHDNRDAAAGLSEVSSEFNRQVDLRVLELWTQGRFREFLAMLPEYARLCDGEGLMHDTAMLLGALGWDAYKGRVEIVTDYFAASGTGQVNAVFPLD